MIEPAKSAPSDLAVRVLGALVVALALIAVGCGDAPVRRDATLAPELLVWPKPPATPRYRFVRTVAVPADWGVSSGAWAGLLGAFTGQSPLRFVRPTGVVERNGALWVADPGAPALVILDRSAGRELKLTRLGNVSLVSPVSLALGPADTAFLADSALGRIFVVDRQGRAVRTIAHPAMRRPTGLAYSAPADRLYVADSAVHCIFVFTADGRYLATFGGSGAGEGRFNFPTHLALTPTGDLLVNDTLNFRIQVFAPDGQPLGVFGRAGDGSGDFASPKGVAVDSSGNVYVVDALFDAVQVFRREGSLLLGFAERGVQPGRLWLPTGLYIDANDRIYVADSYNQRVAIFERLRPEGREDAE